MDAIEKLAEVIYDHDTLVNILNHIQNPCMQVTAVPEAMEARAPCFLKDPVVTDKFDELLVALEDLGESHSTYMEKLWLLLQQCTDMNTVCNVMNNVFIPPIQVTVTSRSAEEAKERKSLQELAASRHVPDPKRLPAQCSESTRVLAAFAYFVLLRQISGQPATAATCAEVYSCNIATLEQLIMGKAQGGKGGKGGKGKRKSSTKGGPEEKKAKGDEEDDD